MVVVDNLDERLNLGALGNLLLTHLLGDLERSAFDTSDNGVTIWSFLGSFIVVYTHMLNKLDIDIALFLNLTANNNCLLTGIATL